MGLTRTSYNLVFIKRVTNLLFSWDDEAGVSSTLPASPIFNMELYLCTKNEILVILNYTVVGVMTLQMRVTSENITLILMLKATYTILGFPFS